MSQNVKEEVLLQIPGCSVHLVDESEPVELASGELKLVRVSSDNKVTLEMIVRVGLDLQWPVVKDKPVMKVNAREYLFTLPVEDGDPLRYEVTFSGEDGDVVKSLEFLEDFLRENSCFSSSSKNNNEIDWKDFSPKAEEYKSVVAKAIAGGTGHIIKGIFTCSNSYSKKVHRAGSAITVTKETEDQSGDASQINEGDKNATKKKNKMNTNLQRVEKMWNASESIGATVLDGEGMVSGLMIAPVVKSKLGKALLSTAPGEVLLASLDSFNKILGAAEAAEIQTHSASSMAATKLMSKSFGEKAGKTTGKVLETTGSLGRTAWKIQKAIEPSFSMASEIAKNAPRQ